MNSFRTFCEDFTGMASSLFRNVTDQAMLGVIADYLEDQANPLSDYIRSIMNASGDESKVDKELREKVLNYLKDKGVVNQEYSRSVRYKLRNYSISSNGRVRIWNDDTNPHWTPIKPEKIPPAALEGLLFKLMEKYRESMIMMYHGNNSEQKHLRAMLFQWLNSIRNELNQPRDDEHELALNSMVRATIRTLAQYRDQFKANKELFRGEVESYMRAFQWSGNQRVTQLIAVLRRIFP